jgi:antitoxin HigA-1
MPTFMPALTVGEFLQEEYMRPCNLSVYRLAKDMNVPVSRIQEILNNRRKISLDTALRLSHYFGTSDEYFVALQMKIDLEAKKLTIKKEIDSLPVCKECV